MDKKLDRMGRLILARGEEIIATLDGSATLAEAFVREAVAFARQGSEDRHQLAFERGLARDGFVIAWGEWDRVPSLSIALPDEVQLPASDDEVRSLLRQFQFVVPLSHFDQAVEAHTRGGWAAANAQLRTFLEGLFDHIARHIDHARATSMPSSENRRAMLADPGIGFLAQDRGEWTPDGKNYLNGLFKMLHTHGSHPGLSDEDHCTFRLHVVLVTARTFLRRLSQGRR